MSDWIPLIIAGAIIGLLSALIWWLFIASEGVYLGRRVVIWLYDLYAHRYDGVKDYVPEYEQLFLANPLMEVIAPSTTPLVLDVATGTGRLPLALARHEEFAGRVIGIDLSRKMLQHAAHHLRVFEHCTSLVWCPAEALPFENDTFDVVTCLEALEFMSSPEAVVKELIRVLRRGGALLVTQRINTHMMPGKVWSAGDMLAILQRNGIEQAHAQIWQVDYRKVWGHKPGESASAGARPLAEILRCPSCGQVGFKEEDRYYTCRQCGSTAAKGDDGVVELNSVYKKQHQS